MVWLTEVEEHDESYTRCRAGIERLGPFRDADGGAGAWVALELMAQCIAAHAGIEGRLLGEPPRVGLLLGSRRVRFHCPRYAPDQQLSVVAVRIWGRESGLVSFDCRVEDAGRKRRLAEGRLNCFVPGPDAEIPLPG